MIDSAPRATVSYLGHATVLLDLGGVRLLTDPLLRNRVAHLRRACEVDARSLRGVDAVLVSHLHYDHLDIPSLQRLGQEMPVVAPRGAGGLIRKRLGARHVVEIGDGEQVEIGALTIRATRAEHDAGRLPFGARADPLGFVIRGAERVVYFAGDTDVFDEMREIGPLDVALLPIWGWGPTLGPGHMDPARAAQAAGLLGARLAIPIHWGTYYPISAGIRGAPGFLETPPAAFAEALRTFSPGTRLRVLRPGESTAI